MAYNPFTPKRKIRPSILDRLIDDAPDKLMDAPVSTEDQMQSLKENVRRDIEVLFNTRVRSISPHRESAHFDQSLLNYGVPDLTTLNLKQSDQQQKLCRRLEAQIHQFEPRFKTVRVIPRENIATKDNDNRYFSLRLRIEATLHADPVPETIVFDSIMEPITRTLDVEVTRER